MGFRAGDILAVELLVEIDGFSQFWPPSAANDSLGLVAPVLLPVKRLLRELCRDGLKWDDKLPMD